MPSTLTFLPFSMCVRVAVVLISLVAPFLCRVAYFFGRNVATSGCYSTYTISFPLPWFHIPGLTVG